MTELMSASIRKTKFVLWSGAIVVGLLQSWANRFAMEPDGVNYLDVAQAYSRHDWHNAINSYWSPLYSWILALVISHVSLYEESTALHVINFCLYLLTLWAFAFFIDELGPPDSISHRAWLIFGYTLFVYGMLVLIGLGTSTPDMGVAALFFAVTGMLIRVRRKPGTLAYAALGAILGVSYLAKAIMFPLAFVCLLCTTSRRALLSLAIFLAVASPFIVILSKHQGRPTFGDVGRIAYIAFVDGLEQYPHWHGEGGVGSPVHGPRLIYSHPDVDEFGTPIAGTYPPWYDGAYWLEGASVKFSLSGQAHALRTTIGNYFAYVSSERCLLVGVLILVFLNSWRSYLHSLMRFWPILLPALALFMLYALVYVETRYIGAAVVVVWMCLFAALPNVATRRVGDCVVLVVALSLFVTIFVGAARDLKTRPVHTQWRIASDLRNAGLRSGESVAVLGHSTAGDYWAHLAQVRIVADMPSQELDMFWQANQQTQNRVIDAFAGTGAHFLITPKRPMVPGWIPVGDYYAFDLRDH